MTFRELIVKKYPFFQFIFSCVDLRNLSPSFTNNIKSLYFWKMYCTCFIVFALLLFDPAWAANYNMSGIVDDSVSLQPIAGVVVSIANTTIQTVTDSAGRFTLKNVPAGCTICFVHISYHTTCQKWQGKDNNLLFLLPPTAVEAEKVIIINNRTNDTKRIEPGAFTIKNETLRAQPLLLGEHDVIKFLQLTPGVAKTDIAQGYIVRGGGADQNLVLLDGLPVYNPNHLFGIFSAFNSPAIQSVTLLKSGAPANYGGKLSSILEIETLKKQSKPFVADINVGMLSASAVMAQNLDSDKVSMLVSVRKSYIDELIKPAVTPFLSSNNLFSTSSTNFYDLFSKVSYRYNQSNELSMTGFTSFDKYSLNSHLAGLTTLASWQNTGGQVAWRHFGQNSFTLCRVYYSGYQFNFDIAQSGLLLSMDSHLYEVVGLLQQQFYFAKHTLKYGIEVNKYMVRPNQGNVIIENQLLNQNQVQNNHAIDASAFLSDEVQIFVKTKLVAGIRFSDILAIGLILPKLCCIRTPLRLIL